MVFSSYHLGIIFLVTETKTTRERQNNWLSIYLTHKMYIQLLRLRGFHPRIKALVRVPPDKVSSV